MMNKPQEPTVTQPITQAVPCPPQYANGTYYPLPQQLTTIQTNPLAKRAMINGFISLALSLLTLASLIGFAGLVTGSLAIIYGFIGINRATNLSTRKGFAQAATGIALGSIAWFIVIFSLIIRYAVHGNWG